MSVATGDDQLGSGGDDVLLGNAVFFFRDGRLVSELREAEFQSLLSGVAALSELADGERDAVFCEVGSGLVARAFVFFRIGFDQLGRPDNQFSIPLADVARRAGAGPDLGFGRVRLACRGQCPIPWLANRLWQPRSLTVDGECGIVQRALQKNRLGFRPHPNRSRRDGNATFDGRATLDGRATFDGRATLDSRRRHAARAEGPPDSPLNARTHGRVDSRSDMVPDHGGSTYSSRLAGEIATGNTLGSDARLGPMDGRLVVPQLVRQYQARIEALEIERSKCREQLLAAKGEASRLAEELAQERERSRRLERMLRGSDFS